MTFDDLDTEDRLRLIRFVCTFAWADLEMADTEKDFVRKLMKQLELSDEEERKVESWLKLPPRPEEVDPTDIPADHRQVFLNTILGVVGADGVVDPAEVENLSLLEQLLR